jgi:hypothetical protein
MLLNSVLGIVPEKVDQGTTLEWSRSPYVSGAPSPRYLTSECSFIQVNKNEERSSVVG